MDFFTLFMVLIGLSIIVCWITICATNDKLVENVICAVLLCSVVALSMVLIVSHESYKKGQSDALNGKYKYRLTETKIVERFYRDDPTTSNTTTSNTTTSNTTVDNGR